MSGRFDLCVITHQLARLGRDHLAVARAALQGGASMIQLRDKEMTTRALVEVAQELRRLTEQNQTTFIVNDRVDVAQAVGADGVHLGPDDMPVTIARRLLGPKAVIGASVADPGEARAAEAAGANYVSVGAVYPTASKANAGDAVGVRAITSVKRVAGVPVLAIGGINCDNVETVIEAGADGAAVIAAVAEADDMVLATEALLTVIHRARAGRGADS